MMFEQFQYQVLDDMKNRFPDMSIELREVTKLQGQSYKGLCVRAEGECSAASINLQSFFNQLEEGTSFKKVMDEIVDFVLKGYEQRPRIDLQEFMNYEKMKESLTMQMIPIKGNESKLEEIPHKVIEDMATVYRLEIDRSEDRISSALITNSMLQSYGITQEQLHEDALEVSVKTYPASLRNMTDVIKEMMDDIAFLIPDEPSPMWIASIEGGINGAVAIQYPGFLDNAAKQLGGDFFVLPSSVHETLFVADDGSIPLERLEEMVRDVNLTDVSIEDRLSNSVFHYDSEAHIFENARTFEMRMADRDYPEKESITVLLVEPFQHPKVIEITNELEHLQKAVGGNIEVTYPFDDLVGLIMNEEGKISGMPLNRALYDNKGDVYDVIAGPFLVVGLTSDNFGSLSADQMKCFKERFHQPETFIRMGKGVMSIPIPEEKVNHAHKQMENALRDKTRETKGNTKGKKQREMHIK